VPALTTRRVSTTVELADGESFVFAGLLQDDVQTDANLSPWAGDLPLVGALFRADRVRHDRLQLAVIVTAHLMPAPETDAPQEPEDLKLAQPTPAAAPAPKRPGLLTRVLDRSPAARAVAGRVATVFHDAVDVSRRGLTALEGWSRRVFAARPPAAMASATD